MARKPSESAARHDKNPPPARARAAKPVAAGGAPAERARDERLEPPTGTVALPATAAQIAERAYLKWLSRGSPIGDAERDWFEAEAEARRETEPA